MQRRIRTEETNTLYVLRCQVEKRGKLAREASALYNEALKQLCEAPEFEEKSFSEKIDYLDKECSLSGVRLGHWAWSELAGLGHKMKLSEVVELAKHDKPALKALNPEKR